MPSVPRRFLAVLVFGLPVITVATSVVLAFYALLVALGDAWGAKLLLAVGTSGLMLLIMDMVLLVGLLGLDVLERHERDELVEEIQDEVERE